MKAVKILMAVFIALAFASIAWAQDEVDLPKTGQTLCYSESGVQIPCQGTGQDGDWQAGVAWPSPRFAIIYCNNTGPCPSQSGDCDNIKENDVVEDKLTGLIWARNADLPNQSVKKWVDALTYANNLTLCGYDDWRLPNVNELESLFHSGVTNNVSWLISQNFVKVRHGRYWSSTTFQPNKAQAWCMVSADGIVQNYGKVVPDNDPILHLVWPVRGSTANSIAEIPKTGQKLCYSESGEEISCQDTGQDGDLQAGVAWPSPRFTDNNNGTVTDNLTGLVWLKNAYCGNQPFTWTTALNLANNLANGLCGLTDGSFAGDWRLPNRKELKSLIDYSRNNPALPLGHPFTNVQHFPYWTSSNVSTATDKTWVYFVSMGNGTVIYTKKEYVSRFWAVREGQVDMYDLNIAKEGTGTGRVTSNPPRIDCGSTCSAEFRKNSTVTLTAEPATDSLFVGWSNHCSGTNQTTQVSMDEDKNCTATFNLKTYTLTVTKSGTGSGTVNATGCTLSWGGAGNNTGTCTVNHGTLITLSGSPAEGSTWDGWTEGSGSASACIHTGVCSFNITQDSSVKATFTLIQYTVTANAIGNGSGSVSSDPAGINYNYPANNSGNANFDHGINVVLTATANEGSTVAWTTCPGSTGGTPTEATCTINSLDGDKTAVATINSVAAPANLTAWAISSSSIMLGWRDRSTNEQGFKIERKPGDCSAGGTWIEIEIVPDNTTTFTNAGLSPNTTYSYRVRAYNASGDSLYSNCASSTTGVSGTPNSPTELRAVSVSVNQINLTWVDNSNNETSFRIFRRYGREATDKWVRIATTSANTISYNDTAAINNTHNLDGKSYSYKIQACNASGCSPATTAAIVPFSPTSLTATAQSSTEIKLDWTDRSHDEQNFQIQRKTGSCDSPGAWNVVATKNANIITHTDALPQEGTYSYRVRATRRSAQVPLAFGFSSWSNCETVTTP